MNFMLFVRLSFPWFFEASFYRGYDLKNQYSVLYAYINISRFIFYQNVHMCVTRFLFLTILIQIFSRVDDEIITWIEINIDWN